MFPSFTSTLTISKMWEAPYGAVVGTSAVNVTNSSGPAGSGVGVKKVKLTRPGVSRL